MCIQAYKFTEGDYFVMGEFIFIMGELLYEKH